MIRDQQCGWEVSGINDAIKIGLSKLPTLDPFKHIIDIEEHVDFALHGSGGVSTYPGEENLNVNNRESDEQWEGDEERNAFDIFA